MLHFYHFTHLSRYHEIDHMVTTKDTTQPYSFSLALHTGETPSDIIHNRYTLAKNFDSNTLHFIVANQTHSDNIHIVTHKITQGWAQQEDAIANCDALITKECDIALCILTADCVPILLYDTHQHVVAAVHAGWKGTKSQIVSKTVKKMVKTFGSDSKDILAGIGPSIGACCYEVGEDVAMHFKDIENAYIQKGNKYMLNLPAINKVQLLNEGISTQNIEMSNICTACEVKDFFSYRKEQGCSGRFMSIIMVKDNNENKSLL